MLAAILIGSLVLAVFGHAFLNYDGFYQLVWGADLAAGRRPFYAAPIAPTPHPLAIGIGALLSPLGDWAEEATIAIGLLALGALGVGLFRLGQELYATAVGLLAAAIVLTRVPILNFGIRGYVDLPMLALVVWAAVLEVRRPRRGAPVLVLLALAGLLRPEVWLLTVAYWLWLVPPLRWARRVRLALLAAAAPVVWSLSDLLVTGDPLWSLHGTSALASTLERPIGLDEVYWIVPRRLGEILRLPELIAAVLGFAAGVAWLRRRMALPVAIAALNGVAFLVFAVADLPLLGRYLYPSAAMLALFAGLAAFGWRALGDDHPARRSWRAAGFVVLAAIVVFSPLQVRRIEALRAEIARRDQVQADLRTLVRDPAAGAALARCGPLYVPNHRPLPLLDYWTGMRPPAIRSAGLERPSRDGLYIAPANPAVAELSILDPKDPRPVNPAPPRAYRVVLQNRSWKLLAGCRQVG